MTIATASHAQTTSLGYGTIARPEDMRVAIITPVLFGAHGAAVYYRSLAQRLGAAGYSVLILTDKEPGTCEAEVRRVFPRRCGLDGRDSAQVLRFLWEMSLYPRALAEAAAWNPNRLLIHGSFFRRLSPMPLVLRRFMARYPGSKIIVDIRDNGARLDRLAGLDCQVIVCSEAVRDRALQVGIPVERVHYIPVPVDVQPVCPSPGDVRRKFGLSEDPIVCSVGLLKPEKGTDRVLRAAELLNSAGLQFQLVLVGHLKTRSRSIVSKLKDSHVRWLGPLPHEETLGAIRASKVIVSASRSEGLPRSLLEALAVGTDVIVPPGIGEFAAWCPAAVAEESAEGLAGQIKRSLQGETVCPPYPIGNHSYTATWPQYERLLLS